MCNGEIAIVMESNPLKRLRPKFALLLTKKQPVKPRLIAFDIENQDNDGQTAIMAIIRPESFAIDKVKIYRLVLLKPVLS